MTSKFLSGIILTAFLISAAGSLLTAAGDGTSPPPAERGAGATEKRIISS